MDLSPIRPRNGWRSYLYSSKIPHYVLDSARKANRPLKDVTLWTPMRHACWRCSRPLPGVRARTETNSHFGASTDATRRDAGDVGQRQDLLNPTAHQYGGRSLKRIFSNPASVNIWRISSAVKRCSSGVPNRSKASVLIT